jgi:DNA-binding transcriptional MocR family regulator
MLDLEQYQISGTNAKQIAASVESAIRSGELPAGATLPTVRDLAKTLGTSPATVSSAYGTLAQRGLVIGEGRRGTRVAPRPALRVPKRAPRTEGARDLALGLPDPELLPDLQPALARLDIDRSVRMTTLEANDEQLLAHFCAWYERDGVPADSIAIVSGAFDGIERVLRARLRPGDRVIVEDPTYVSIRDVLVALGLVAVPVPVDDRGWLPQALEAALEKDARAAVVVPRAQNPYGAALDEERAAQLRALLATRPQLLVVEDDHAGLVCGAPFASLRAPDRERWALVRSVSKFLHPDMRLAAVAGDETTIARVEGLQALGPRWVSHILQSLAAALFADPGFDAMIGRAASAYTARREAMLAALAAAGVPAHGRAGLNVWIPVREEAVAAATLLDAGWMVTAGELFRLTSGPGVRVTIATLREDEAEEFAAVVADVERAGRSRRAY